MAPGPAEAAVAERHQDAHSDHAGMARFLLVGGGIDEGAEASMTAIMDKVDKVVRHGMET